MGRGKKSVIAHTPEVGHKFLLDRLDNIDRAVDKVLHNS
jgi:hypothetical protein